MNLKQYRKKQQQTVEAMPLALPDCTIEYQKWGGTQRAKQGDWLVNHDEEYYTVDATSFRNTYKSVGGNQYQKVGKVWAEVAEQAGEIHTKEGITRYQKGDIRVYNQPDKTDGYAMSAETFYYNYDLDESPSFQGNIMHAQQYIEQRVDDQIRWYENKAAVNQKRYKQCQLGAIIFGAAIPLLTAVSFEELEVLLRFTIALLGSLIAIMNALVSLYKFQENWVQYRTAAESLIREKMLYITQSQPYDGEEDANFKQFVERCEVIMSSENSLWGKQTAAEIEGLAKQNKSKKTSNKS